MIAALLAILVLQVLAYARSELYLPVPFPTAARWRGRPINIPTSILSLPRGGGDDGSADGSAAIQMITSLAQIERILQAQTDDSATTTTTPLIVLYFTANNCPPCKMIGPIYEDMSELAEFDNVRFCKVNVNDCPDVAERFDVDGWPTFLLFKDRKFVDSIVGGMAAKEGLYSLIAKYV